MPTVVKIILYPVFAVFCLVLFFIILFPFDSLKARFAGELERGLGGGYRISIGDLSPSLFTGVTLKNVEILSMGNPEAKPIKVPRAKFHFALMSLLSGGAEFSFDLKGEQGHASGSFSSRKSGFSLDARAENFDVALASLIAQVPNLPVEGTLSGSIELDIYADDPLRNSGTVSLNLPELRLKEQSLSSRGVQMPVIQLAQAGGAPAKISFSMTRGNFEIREIRFSGIGLDFQSDGKIYGARRAENFRFNLKGSVKLTPELASGIQLRMGGAHDPAEAVMLKLSDVLPGIEKQKSADGSYPFTITGRLSQPNIRIGDFRVPI